MPANNVRLGGAYFTFTADARGYEVGANRAIAANRRLAASYGQFAVQLRGTQALAGQFAQSLRSSLLATAAYAAGVGLASAALRGVVGGFLAYDRSLIQISKTTGIAGDALERLGQRIQALGTGPSGLRPALPILREELFAIATAAGQAGIQTSAGIERITRAAAELQVSSDLIGSDAVRALTRYLNVTGQGIERTDAIASAYTHLGNNIVGTESEIASFATRLAQNLSAVGRASDEFILGVSASLVEFGVQQEAAGSAVQRTQIALLRLAEDPTRFHAFADAIGGTSEEVEQLRQRFIEGTASAEDFDRVFLAFLRRVRETGPTRRQSFIADIIGGGEANVRNTRVIGLLAERLPRVRRNMRLVGEATREANFHTREAARASEAQSSALQIVGNRLQEQATAIGRHVNPALIAVAENFEVVEAAAAASAAAIASGFVRRRVTAFRDAQREAGKASAAAAADLNRHRTEIVRTDEALRQSAANRRTYTASFERERVLRRDVARATRVQAQAETAYSRAAAASAATRAQVGGVYAALGRNQIDRDAVRARQALDRANERVARSTAALGAIETQRSAIGIRNSREYTQAVRAEQRQRARLNSLRAQAAEAQRNVNRQVSVGSRLLRGFRGALNLVGGPLGLLTTALAFGATAWLLWGDSVDESAEKSRRLVDNLKQLNEGLERQRGGRTEAGAIIDQTRARIDELDAVIGPLQQRLSRLTPRQIFRQGLGDEQRDLATALEERLELQTLLTRLTENLNAQGGETERRVTRQAAAFRALAPSVEQAGRAVAQFIERLRQQFDTQQRLNRVENRNIGATLLDARTRRAAAEFQIRVDREREGVVLRLRAAEATLGDAQARRANAQRQIDDGTLSIGSTARKEAEAALRTEERRIATQEQVIARLRRQIELLTRVEVQTDAIRRAEENRRRTEIAQRLAAPVQGRQADILAQEAEATRSLADLRRRVTQEEAAFARQSDLTVARTRREDAANAARTGILREYAETQEDAARAIASAARQEARAKRELEAINAQIRISGINVSDALLDQRDAARDNVAQLAATRVEAETLAAALRELGPEYEELANRAAALAEAQTRGPLDDLADQAGRLSDRLEEVAARGFNSLSDSIAALVLEGKASFRDLANSIIEDLVRVLIQAQVVAPLVQALTGSAGFFGGFFGGGGNFNFGPGPNPFHTGGVGGLTRNAPLARPRGLRSDELFAVLLKGEVVVPRELARRARYGGADGMAELRQWISRLPRFHEGGVAGGGFGTGPGGVTRIELVNQSNTRLEAVDNGTRVDGADYVRTVILRDARTNGPITRGLGRALRGS